MRFSLILPAFAVSIFSYLPIFSQGLPIKPARTVSFTTDEGTYMNIDLSPDGKTLVFDLLGDLYTLPVQGGKATQITRGMALNLSPIWSPGGKKIACLSDYSGSFHVNVLDLNAKHRQIIGERDPDLYHYSPFQWTSDGSYIIYDNAIHGLAGQKLSFNTKGRHILRTSSDGQTEYFIESRNLYSYDEVTQIKNLISPVLKRYNSIVLSPDARWLCYVLDSNAKTALVLQNLTTQKTVMLVPSLFLQKYNVPPNPLLLHFCFSPDSKNIFICYGGKIHHIAISDGADVIVPFQANVHSDLGPYDYNVFPISHDSISIRYTRSANSSPDGKSVVFSALNKIYVMDVTTKRSHLLVTQPINQSSPAYSPDGQWIAYVSWCDTIGGFLWRVRSTGGTPEKLTQIPGIYVAPTWSPNGTKIAVLRSRVWPGSVQYTNTTPGDLLLISVDGSKEQIIDDSVSLSTSLSFSSDGNQIIYTPKRNRSNHNSLKPQLVSQNLQEKESEIISVGSDITYEQQKSVSPNGHYIVLSTAEDLYLVPTCNLIHPMSISDSNNHPLGLRFAHGVDPYWEKNGTLLAWTYGNHFYEFDPDEILANAINIAEGISASPSGAEGFLTAWLTPVKGIPLTIKAPTLYAHGTIVLKNARIITMRGNEIISNGAILIKDGRFLAMGTMQQITIPNAAKVIDLAGKTVIPGFIDLHLHMFSPSKIIPQQYWAYLANLAYGVTTARDPASNFESFRFGELIKTGEMLGPRFYTVGSPVRFNDGVVRFDNVDDASSVVQKRLELGAIYIKDYLPPPRIHRQWLLIASRKAGLNMTNEGYGDAVLELAMIKDGSTGVEHNPAWGDVYNDITSFIAASRSYFTPTLQVSGLDWMDWGKEYFKFKYWHQPDEKLKRFSFSNPKIKSGGNGTESIEAIENSRPRDSVNPGFLADAIIDARILHAGGRVCLGSHGNVEGIGVHNELWALQMGGMTNMEALQCATIRGAEALGLQKDLGSIEVGKIADLIVLNKNPLDDIHNSREIRYVMKDGILYDGDTLDEIWPMQKKCPEWRLHEAHN